MHPDPDAIVRITVKVDLLTAKGKHITKPCFVDVNTGELLANLAEACYQDAFFGALTKHEGEL